MMTRFLLATDFSDASRPALRRAVRLAARGDVEITLLHVHQTTRAEAAGEPGARELAAEERNTIDLLSLAAREELERAGARVRELKLEGVPGELIVDAARAERADLLLLGTHGRGGVRRILLGSVAEKVARGSSIPVLIARGPAERGFERVLVAIDLDERSERAAAAACDLAAPGATVDLVHCVAMAPLTSIPGQTWVMNELPRIEAGARSYGAELVERLRRPGLEPRFSVDFEDPRSAVLHRIDVHGHDLVAVGSHGRGGLSRVALGSVSESILRHAACSVLITR
jgi:nucleotide-binding universal stress UspA family protein